MKTRRRHSKWLLCALVVLPFMLGTVPAAADSPWPSFSLVSTGGNHTCGVTTAGAAVCWGSNYSGKLGTGTYSDDKLVPQQVFGLDSGVVGVSAGELDTSCAVLASGAAKCWGDGFWGQLGNGTRDSSLIPVPVTGLDAGVAQVSVGYQHACAVMTAGAAKCWGENHDRQLGSGTTDDSFVPVTVTGLSSGVTQIGAGVGHSCALTSAGAVKCWGRNVFGTLGNGSTEDSSVPVGVTGLDSGVVAISVGSYHTCALKSSGAVRCWGWNSKGQLGDGTPSPDSNTFSSVPVQVVGLGSGSGVVAVDAGWQHTCALTDAGAVTCWGGNHSGELGNGTTSDSSVPVDVTGLGSGVAGISAGGREARDGSDGAWAQTCGVTSPGPGECWGRNANGQLGDGTTTDRRTPTSYIAPIVIPVQPQSIRVVVVTPVYAAKQFTVKMYALDAAGNVISDYRAPADWSDLSGHLSPSAPPGFYWGYGATTSATISIPFKGDKITVTALNGASGTSAAFGVVGPFAGLTTTVQKPVTAGVPFTFTAQAVDSAGNFVKSYNAPATWSDLSGQLSPATPANFVSGVSRTSATVANPFHADKITIASGGKVRQSGAFDVLGPLSSIAVTVPSSVTHGVPFSVKAVAKDAVGDTLSTYNQTATWSSISGGLSPAAPSAFKNGVSTTAATFATAFTNNRITVTSGGINGQSNLFNVL